MLHPDDAERLQQVWAGARARNELYEAEGALRGRDGAYRWFLVRAEPLLDEGGGVVGWIGTDTDIHDRRQAEAALHESERQLSNERGLLRAIFQQAPVGISIAGATPDVPSTLNVRAQEMLGTAWASRGMRAMPAWRAPRRWSALRTRRLPDAAGPAAGRGHPLRGDALPQRDDR